MNRLQEGERERESAQGGRSDATLLLSLEREREMQRFD